VLSANTSSPQIGDDVVLQRTGRDTVTVKRAERGADGKLSPKEVAVFRNRWVIEKQSFLDARAAAAQTVRDLGAKRRVSTPSSPGPISRCGLRSPLRARSAIRRISGDSSLRFAARLRMRSSRANRCSRFGYANALREYR